MSMENEFPVTKFKLGPCNYQEWSYELLKLLGPWAHTPFGQYLIEGEDMFSLLEGREKNDLRSRMDFIFQRFMDWNQAVDDDHYPYLISRRTMISSHYDLSTHDLEERAEFLKDLSLIKKERDPMKYYRMTVLNKVTALEFVLVDVIACDQAKYDVQEITRLLTEVVKIHNQVRKVWNPKTFVENVYNFSTSVTECATIPEGPWSKTAFADSIGLELDALFRLLRSEDSDGMTGFGRLRIHL